MTEPKIKKIDDIQALPFVSVAKRAELPQCAAVYFALDPLRSKVLYIGSSRSLRGRWRVHPHRRSTAFIAWLAIEESGKRYETECAYIQHFDPPLNYTGDLGVSPEIGSLIKRFAREDERSVAYIVRRLIEESPRIKSALKNGGKRRRQ